MSSKTQHSFPFHFRAALSYPLCPHHCQLREAHVRVKAVKEKVALRYEKCYTASLNNIFDNLEGGISKEELTAVDKQHGPCCLLVCAQYRGLVSSLIVCMLVINPIWLLPATSSGYLHFGHLGHGQISIAENALVASQHKLSFFLAKVSVDFFLCRLALDHVLLLLRMFAITLVFMHQTHQQGQE